jgi:hypothetical protein
MDFTYAENNKMDIDESSVNAALNTTTNCNNYSMVFSKTTIGDFDADEPSYLKDMDVNDVTQVNNTCLEETIDFKVKNYFQSYDNGNENNTGKNISKNGESIEQLTQFEAIETPYADKSRINENFNDFTPRSAIFNSTAQFSALSCKTIGNLTAPNDLPNDTINTTIVNESGIHNVAVTNTIPANSKNKAKDPSILFTSSTVTPKLPMTSSSILANARSLLTPNTSMSGRFSNNILKEIESCDIDQLKLYSLNMFGINLEKINWTEAKDNLKHELARVQEETNAMAENVKIAKKSLEEMMLDLEKKKKSTIEQKAKLNDTNEQIEKAMSKVSQNKDQLDFFIFKDSDLERAQNGKIVFNVFR